MIIVKLMGGHGNQMFQYAMGRCLAHKHNTTLKLDTNYYKIYDPSLGLRQREYVLDIFNIKAQIATAFELSLFKGNAPLKLLQLPLKVVRKLKKYHWLIEKDIGFDERALHFPDNSYLEGHWQSPKYFSPIENILRKEFAIKMNFNEESALLSEKIKNSESVGIFIRRQDFVNHPLHGACDLHYYNKAINLICNKISLPLFFIFSDDIHWCKENMGTLPSSFFIGPELAGHKYSSDFSLFSLCNHFIISNSTYGWWAAWLGRHPNKIVVAPEKWYHDEKQNSKTSDLFPYDWIKI